jgi:hypothetical protein
MKFTVLAIVLAKVEMHFVDARWATTAVLGVLIPF